MQTIAYIFLLVTLQAAAQVGTEDQGATQALLSPGTVHSYLRQKDGIVKLSAKVGDVTLSESDERWGEHSLSSLTKSSDLIVVATITHSQSDLTADGDEISTTYKLQITETLKGGSVDDLTVSSRGGTLVLPNGHIATLHTPLWDGLKQGQGYIFFLQRGATTFIPVGASYGVLELNRSKDIVSVLNGENHDLSIRKEVSGIPIASVENQIHNLALSN